MQRIRVNSPYGRTPSYLNWYLDALGKDRNGRVILRLQAPLKEAGIPTGLIVAKDVVAEFNYVDSPGALEEKTNVCWKPQDGSPYPAFNGSITIEADEDYGSSWLRLEGSYDPPFGIAGDIFDAAIGKRIALATARELLERLRDAMEQAHWDGTTR